MVEAPILIEAIAGFAIFFITAITNQLIKISNGRIKGEWIVAFFAIVAGAIYYWINQENPDLVKKIASFLVGAFGVSQIIYLYLFKKIK